MIKWAVVIGLQSIFFIEADMEIIKASVVGFCFGVKRAVEIAENVLQENIDSKNKVYSLGPLIHNPNVLKWQAELANEYSIDGMIFYHYYF